jgi:hypothetical protein
MTTPPHDPAAGAGGVPDVIVPDGKDWTWTLRRRCPDCGFEAAAVPANDIAARVTAYTDPWPHRLEHPDATTRPTPATWSPLEYACHVRDVCRLFEGRLRLILGEDRPTFANWDQDATAVAEGYAEQEPVAVGREVVVAAAGLAGAYAGVPAAAWSRTGLRSDGSEFTALTLGQYGLHDLAHHLWDVGVDIP